MFDNHNSNAKRVMKMKYIIPALFGLTAFAAQAQQPLPPPNAQDLDTNPFVKEGVVEPAPLLPLEFGGTGNVRFDVGNTGSDDIVWVDGQAMTLVITLSKGVPDVGDPNDPLDALNALSGPGVAWFEWSYDPSITTFFASQIATIPGTPTGGTWERINIAYRVAENSFLGAPPTVSNGFNVNLQPPPWTNPQPTDDDQVSSYTYVQAFDFGDAPESYGAPSHEIDLTKDLSTGRYNRFVYLGEHIDAENEPQHSANADGDDLNTANGLNGVAANDEDGVVFPSLMFPGETYNIPVTVTIYDFDAEENLVPVNLRGWIDWDGNGSFALASERVIDLNVVQFLELEDNEESWMGPRSFLINVPVTVPANAEPGNYFSRWRVGPVVGTTANAAWGEVEDHMFQVQDIPNGSISGFVRADTTGDLDGNIVLGGVPLALLDENGDPVLDGGGQPITTVTDSNGFYQFEDVPPGLYQVAITAVTPGYQPFSSADGGDPELIGDVTLIEVLSGEENENNDFLKYLQACPDTWTAWQDKWGDELDGQTGPLDNPDGDRYSNLIEYAFCLPPNSGEGKPFCLFASESVAGAVDGLYRRTAIGGAKDVTYTLEWTDTLGIPTSWTGNVVLDSSNTSVVNNGDGTETVRITDLETLTGLTDGIGFVRIRVDLDDGTTQASDATDVLGWRETEMELCCRTYNNPFLQCALFTGTVASVDGQDLLFVGSVTENTDLGELLQSGASYYIEVETGTLAGHRFDVTAAEDGTLTLANDSSLCSLDAPFNTMLGVAPNDLVGGRVALHRHWTLDTLFPPDQFGAGKNQSESDEVQIFSGGQWRIYWLYADTDLGIPARWIDAADGDMLDQGASVIPPGQGMFFHNRTEPVDILAYGEVREHGFVRPLCEGHNLVGGGYPIDQSANQRNYTLTYNAPNTPEGLFGSGDFATADSFFLWRTDADPLANGYDSYYLLDSAGFKRWVKVGDSLENRANEILFLGDRAAFLRVRDDHPDHSVSAPWAPGAPSQP